MRLLNIGCGSTLHPDWTNIDSVAVSPAVQSHDLRKGLPYPDEYFDVCYSSHVLEHLTLNEARNLLSEIKRVLKPQGVVRVVVPDLAAIARSYLAMLEQAEVGEVNAEDNYDWMMLELCDQMVRRFSGGEMRGYLASPTIKNKDFVRMRVGLEAERLWAVAGHAPPPSLLRRIASYPWPRLIPKFRVMLAQSLVRVFAGEESRKAFVEGSFRRSGEVHQWMYDRFSLCRLLAQSGFVDICVCRADESRIPDFRAYELDTIGEEVRKPDSLFMEGIRSD
jgi:SAM-dependent methyltransferase